jgi:hypothetical protein
VWRPSHTAAELAHCPYTAAMPSHVGAEKQGGVMGYHWRELARTYGANLIFAAVSVLATYGGLSVALAAGRALLH